VALGLDSVELGYDLTLDLVPGVRTMAAQGAVTVRSVHNFCPVPVGAPGGHPELFLMTSGDARVRNLAVQYTLRTAEFAAEVGATVVVAHAGRVEMRNLTPKLIALAESGRRYDPRYEKIRLKLMLKRERGVQKHLDRLCLCLDDVLPRLEALGVTLALENLPSWEAVPSEQEAETLLRRYASPRLAYWHDIGHGRVRENLGFIDQRHWLARLGPHLAGVHVHDVAGPAADHLMPPRGEIDFRAFQTLLQPDTVRVIEPAPGTPEPDIREAVRVLAEAWSGTPPAEGDEPA
jgi:sugar phosphate isomerase/epimerase